MASPLKLFADVAPVVIRLREEQGLTYEALERRSEVSESTIRRIEEGKPVMLDNLDKVLTALGVGDELELAGHRARVLRERRQAAGPYHLAEGPALLAADSPPLHVRVRLGEHEALLTLTLADLSSFRREQPELPWSGSGK
jgi:transcriptional regulator with XRE-family HTH domain